MSNKYIKRPVIIEAFQMTKEKRQDNSNWPNWLNEAWNKDVNEVGSLSPKLFPNSDGLDELIIFTLEGTHLCKFNDYIIQGIDGEIYPCKPDIFKKTYEKV